MADMVYVYKEYRDDDSYGNERIEVFSDKDTAEKYLKKRFSIVTGFNDFDAFRSEFGDSDTLEDDYVEIDLGVGHAMQYFAIEEHAVIS